MLAEEKALTKYILATLSATIHANTKLKMACSNMREKYKYVFSKRRILTSISTKQFLFYLFIYLFIYLLFSLLLFCSVGTYDGLTACGCFLPNHVQSDALPELIRIVKPGGYTAKK